jgi:hypothetical protein
MPTAWHKAHKAGSDERELIVAMTAADMLANQIQVESGGTVQAPHLAQPENMSPAVRLSWLLQSLRQLGIETAFLDGAVATAARASGLRTSAVVAQQQAAGRRAGSANRLAADEISLAEALDTWTEQAGWLDVGPGETRPRALVLAENAARQIEGKITAQIFSHADRIFTLLQKKTAELVAEVESLPAMPNGIWMVSDPAQEFAKHIQHRPTWGILVSAHADFWLAHSIADAVRDAAGAGVAQFTALGAPRTSLWLQDWRQEQGDTTFANMRSQLRIRYAAENGWGPGLWRPSDISTTAADRSFAGRLQNTGRAAGVPTSFPGSAA